MKKSRLTIAGLGRELQLAIEASREKKAGDPVVLDLRGLATFTDFFFICSGNTSRQLKTIADAVEEALGRIQVRPDHIEGYPHGDWLLMDYVDFIVHIFTPRSRSYYDLERLWGDADRLAVSDQDSKSQDGARESRIR